MNSTMNGGFQKVGTAFLEKARTRRRLSKKYISVSWERATISAAGGRLQACIHVDSGKSRFLIDCGPLLLDPYETCGDQLR